jgi:hypothetical protein
MKLGRTLAVLLFLVAPIAHANMLGEWQGSGHYHNDEGDAQDLPMVLNLFVSSGRFYFHEFLGSEGDYSVSTEDYEMDSNGNLLFAGQVIGSLSENRFEFGCMSKVSLDSQGKFLDREICDDKTYDHFEGQLVPYGTEDYFSSW